MPWTEFIVALVSLSAGILIGIYIGHSPWQEFKSAVRLDFWKVPSETVELEDLTVEYVNELESERRRELIERLASRRD